MPEAVILSVQTGRTAPLGPNEVPSAFVKTSRAGAVAVTRLGLEGDEQADLTVHGGPEKAVYAYAAARYPQWAWTFRNWRSISRREPWARTSPLRALTKTRFASAISTR